MSSFLNLPDELIELIGDASNTQGDLLALSRTCQACYSILKPRLIAYNIRNHQSSGLRDAARRNDIDLAREFLRRKGVDVNSTAFHRPGVWETPLLFAMECGHEDMAVLLLEHGADHDMGVRCTVPGSSSKPAQGRDYELFASSSEWDACLTFADSRCAATE